MAVRDPDRDDLSRGLGKGHNMRKPWRIAAGVCSLVAAGSFAGIAQSNAAPTDRLAAAADEPAWESNAATDLAARPDRIIVVWDRSADATDKADARQDADTMGVRSLGNARFQLLRPQSGQTVSDAMAALRDDPRVASAERDAFQTLNSTSPTPNDPMLNQLWGLRNTGAKIDGVASATAGADADVVPAWKRTQGTPSTVVADIDTGYDLVGPELKDVMWTNPLESGANAADGVDNDSNGYVDDVDGWDFVGGSSDAPAADNNPTDDNDFDGGHGLHTAGTIGAKGNNGLGITGVAQDVRIMPLRVCSFSSSAGGTRCPISAVVAAMNYAGANHARVANMSLGGTSPSPAQLQALADNPGTLFVISAGNDNVNTESARSYPCSYDPATEAAPAPNAQAIDNVVCVAASDQNDQRASFSNYGATRVDLAAPGTEILSRYPQSDDVWADHFSANNFATNWSAVSGWGRTASGDGDHLTSFGMNDSPGAAPAPSTLERVTSSFSTAVPADAGSCEVKGNRFVHKGSGGSFVYSVFEDGTSVPNLSGITPADTTGSAMAPFQTVPFTAAGSVVSVRFDYTAGSSPTTADGVWLDDIAVSCRHPISDPDDLDFLAGTSMAAPHVTGAAALMFSLEPSASVAAVRNALLGSVHKVQAWNGLVATGGRLDTAAALGRLVPPDTRFVTMPPATSPKNVAFKFGKLDFTADATFECKRDTASYATCAQNKGYTNLSLGNHTVTVRARDLYGNVDPTPAAYTWKVVACTVPGLKNKSLADVRTALPKAGCTLGAVTKPNGVPESNLKVKSTTPAAGAKRASGFAVKVTMIKK